MVWNVDSNETLIHRFVSFFWLYSSALRNWFLVLLCLCNGICILVKFAWRCLLGPCFQNRQNKNNTFCHFSKFLELVLHLKIQEKGEKYDWLLSLLRLQELLVNKPSTYKHEVEFSGTSNIFNPLFFDLRFLSFKELISVSN